MTSNIINLVVVIPADGKILTNGKIYSEKVYLGIYDDINNWYEVDINEAPENWENLQLSEENILSE